MKRRIMMSTMVMAGLALIGCGAKDEASSGGEKKLRIAVIPKAESHIFWKTVQAGAMKAGEELDVDVIWKGPDIPDDRNSQVKTVQNFTVKKVDAIVVAPVDGDVLQKPVESTVKSGINVVVFDSALKDNSKVDSFVATDNYQGGLLCGYDMVKQLNGKGKVIMLRMQEGSLSTTRREEGFLAALKEKGPSIELLSTTEYAGTSVGTAQKKAQLLLSKYGSEVDGIFCPCEYVTEAMLIVLKQMNLAGKVKFIGFDANSPILKGIEDGYISSAAVQDPFNMGYLSVLTAYNSLKGKEFDKRVDTGVSLVNKDNMNNPEIKKITSPDISKYVKL